MKGNTLSHNPADSDHLETIRLNSRGLKTGCVSGDYVGVTMWLRLFRITAIQRLLADICTC